MKPENLKRLTKLKFIGISLLVLTFLFGTSATFAKKDTDKTKIDYTKYLGKGKKTGKYWPTDGWKSCKPEEVGLDSKLLAEAIQFAAAPEYKVKAVLIIKDGCIVGEANFGRKKITSRHPSYSVGKSFSSALIGIAIGQGLIKDIGEKVCQYYDEWDCDDKDEFYSKITLKHVMTLTTGLGWKENWSLNYRGRNDTMEMTKRESFVEYVLERDAMYKPGTHFTYSTGDPMLLSGVIEKVSGLTAFEYAKKNLLKPLGITKLKWASDKAGHTITFATILATARDYAKFGYLFLNHGKWDQKQIVPAKWVETSTRAQRGVWGWEGYGLLWHVNLPVRLSYSHAEYDRDDIEIPSDGYMAEGFRGQNIITIPSKNLVIVRLSSEVKEQMNLVDFIELVLDSYID